MVDCILLIIGILFLLCFALFTFYLAICCFEDNAIIGGVGAFFFSLVCFIGIIYCGYEFFNPSETIEIDGYTYVLEKEPPKEVIEHNGHKYVLEENVNA